MASPPTDYDSPWKDALEQYFQPFLALCASELHAVIDWNHDPQFLDKELQALAHDADAGRRYPDKLVRVLGVDGQPTLILVHVEVQGGSTGPAALAHFGERMFQYFYRISDRYLARCDVSDTEEGDNGAKSGTKSEANDAGNNHNCGVAHDAHNATAQATKTAPSALFSLGVLTQSTGGPPFLDYQRKYLGSGVHFQFPVIHLAKWYKQWDKLERIAATNPFAVVIMAQLQAQASRDGNARLVSKTTLTRLLYQHRYSRNDIWQLLRLINWIIALPPELELAYRHEIDLIEKEQKMTYVTSFERLSREEGLQMGLETGQLQGSVAVLRAQIQNKFGQLPMWVNDRIAAADAPTLQQWALNILSANTIDDVFD